MKHFAASLLLTLVAYSSLALTVPAADTIQEMDRPSSRIEIEGIAGGAPVPMAGANR